MAQAERLVQELEARQAGLSTQLADTGLYGTPEGSARAQELARELDVVRAELADAYTDWEQAAHALERLDAP